MIIDVLTLFPSMFEGFVGESIIKRACDKGAVKINIHNFRDYSLDKNKHVDDYPYGGGAGMVLMCEPIFRAVDDLRGPDSVVIMLTPGGKLFKQSTALKMSSYKHIILLCGHYEGFDERIKSIVDEEISIGDYVLTGGEIPAMVLMDATIRLIDGVISEDSLLSESFNDNLLDYPVYTKPREFRGMKVPDVLLSGKHAEIDRWRDEQRVILTNSREDS